jgi:hypothetical protein
LPPTARDDQRRSESESGVSFSESDDDDFDGEPQEVVVAGGASEESDLDQDGDEGDDESGDQVISYENVPTWEEAISYLLNPGQVQVEPGTGSASNSSRGAPPGDQPRQTRHVGHRKHRR